LLLVLPACSGRPSPDAGPAVNTSFDEIPCIDPPAPRAERRPAQAAGDTSSGTVVIQLVPLDSLHPNVGAQIQLWGGGGGAGGPVDSNGIASVTERSPGQYRLGVRAAASQPRAWSYVLTVRAGRADTVRIDLAAKCRQTAQ
jgi:hypothetical protein